jgi:hypothetical protein
MLGTWLRKDIASVWYYAMQSTLIEINILSDYTKTLHMASVAREAARHKFFFLRAA